MSMPSASLLAKMRADKKVVGEDQLAAAKEKVKELRDGEQLAAELEERLAQVQAKNNAIRYNELPAMMQEIGIDSIGIGADGNHPAYDLKLMPYYHANIAANWDPEKRHAAFSWMEGNGHQDLIKTTITVPLPRDQRSLAKEVKEYLNLRGIPHTEKLDIPHTTLTAFVREQYEKYHRTLPLDILGATVGQVVKLKQRKT